MSPSTVRCSWWPISWISRSSRLILSNVLIEVGYTYVYCKCLYIYEYLCLYCIKKRAAWARRILQATIRGSEGENTWLTVRGGPRDCVAVPTRRSAIRDRADASPSCWQLTSHRTVQGKQALLFGFSLAFFSLLSLSTATTQPSRFSCFWLLCSSHVQPFCTPRWSTRQCSKE
jgi:hypothetical protein